MSGDPLREVSEKMRWQRSRQLLQDTVCLSFKEQRWELVSLSTFHMMWGATIPSPTKHASSCHQILGSNGQLGRPIPTSLLANVEGCRWFYPGRYTILHNRLDLDSRPSNTRFTAVISVAMAEFIAGRLELMLNRMFGQMNEGRWFAWADFGEKVGVSTTTQKQSWWQNNLLHGDPLLTYQQ